MSTGRVSAVRNLAAWIRDSYDPTLGRYGIGIRVASHVSAPPVPSLSPQGVALLGGLVVAIAVAGLAVQRRRRAG